MKPSRFDYVRPAGTAEAVAVLGEAGDDARILAGGLSLVPMMNFRMVSPAVLVDIGGIGELLEIADRGSEVEVGAGVAQAALERWPDLGPRLPLLAEALPHVGHYPTRARGTVGGSIAHADPSAELPLVLATLGGTVRLRSAAGERVVPARAFFEGPLETACRDDEMVVATRWPSAVPGAGHAFDEVALRHGDFAIASASAVVDEKRIVVGFGGVGERPVVREWPRLGRSALDDALAGLADEIEVVDAADGDAAYRRGLVRALGRRTVERAATRPGLRSGCSRRASAAGNAGRRTARPAVPRRWGRARSRPASPAAAAPGRRAPPRRARAERREMRRGGAAPRAPERLPSPRVRPPRGARRMRARGLRRVHGARGRRARARLPPLRRPGARSAGGNRGGSRRPGRGALDPPGIVPSPPRPSVRVLHTGYPDDDDGMARTARGAGSRAERSKGARGAERTSLPLHRLRAHRRRGARCGGGAGRRP